MGITLFNYGISKLRNVSMNLHYMLIGIRAYAFRAISFSREPKDARVSG
jgi:hypothetical protein